MSPVFLSRPHHFPSSWLRGSTGWMEDRRVGTKFWSNILELLSDCQKSQISDQSNLSVYRPHNEENCIQKWLVLQVNMPIAYLKGPLVTSALLLNLPIPAWCFLGIPFLRKMEPAVNSNVADAAAPAASEAEDRTLDPQL